MRIIIYLEIQCQFHRAMVKNKKISAISNVENTLTHLVLNTIKEDNRLIE